MSPRLLLVVVLLASYALISIAAGLLVAFVTHLLSRRGRRLSADMWFWLRLASPASAAALTLACVLPAFMAFEPPHANERPGPLLLALAAMAAVVLATGLARVVRAMWAEQRFDRRWLRHSSIRVSPEIALPLHVVETPTPLAALVGAMRPRLVISADVVRACSSSELQVIGAHEAAHLTARDNLKRVLLDACPDALRWTRTHRNVVNAWSAVTEEEADDRAVSPTDAPARIALAHLLVKIARIAPTCPLPHVSSPFIQRRDFERRVRRLLEPVAPPTRSMRPWWIATSTALITAAGLLAPPASWAAVHSVVELLVGLGR
jgi:beta-lactamase regulating signal transducer with metallopeptidase domain